MTHYKGEIMKKLLLVSALFLALPTTGFGHSDHHHEEAVDKTKATSMSRTYLLDLIKKKKIDATWGKADFLKVEQKKFGKHMEWVATYKNKTTKDEKKSKLYIFMKLSGKYIAANFTGK
jgi:hypothetical protein